MVSDAEGATAVRLAREAIQLGLADPTRGDVARRLRAVDLPPLFDTPRGVFVTLRRGRDGGLRGCIGFALPLFPLRVALARAAVAAATDDPRFPPLPPGELATTSVEVSVLTPPVELVGRTPADREREVVVGRDGLIVDLGDASGLLLPQVAVDEAWDAATFLAQTCVKAGLRPESWRSPAARVRRFEAEVFGEERPGGPVRRVPLGRG